ncbi:MAG: extracellular solute-binding protein [Anaerolineae bacterium]|nr:extracellular solute-binding protein [Anaerolineae bacterium]
MAVQGVTRRRFLKTGAMLVGASVLGACSAIPTQQPIDQGPAVAATAAPEREKASEGPLFLIYASQYSGPPLNAGDIELVNLFEEANPDIRIKLAVWPGQDFHDKLRLLATAGDLPDAFNIETKQYLDMVYRDMILDITELFSANSGLTEDDYWAGEWEKQWFRGKMYLLSLDTQPAVIFYNKDLFDAKGIPYPPRDWTDTEWTYEKMIETAGALTEGEGPSRVWGLAWTRFWPYIYPIAWSLGGSIVSDDRAKSTLTMPETIAAHQMRADLELKYRITPTPDQASEGTDLMFNTNRIAMVATSSSGAWYYKDVPDLHWDIGVMPGGPAGRFTRCPQDGVAVGSQTKHPTEAFEVAMFMAGPEGQRIMDNQLGLGLPTLKSVAEDDSFIHPQVAGLEHLDQTLVVDICRGKYYRHQDVTIKWPEMTSLLSAEQDALLSGHITAEEYCTKMDPLLTELLQSIPEEWRSWVGD